MSQSTANQPRRGYVRSFGGLVGSLIAVLGLVGIFAAMSWLQHGTVADPARTVDYHDALAAARHQAPFHVVAPNPVPAGLRATSVAFDPVGRTVTWHLGFVTPDRQYVGLYQSNGVPAEVIRRSTPTDRTGPTVLVAGKPWHSRTAVGRDEVALVRTSGGVTIVVTGTAGESALAEFAARLH